MNLTNLHIAIVAGSTSSEHDVSLTSATNIYRALKEITPNLYPLYLDKTNQWMLLDATLEAPYQDISRAKPILLQKEDMRLDILSKKQQKIGQIDLFFPALHGKFGEDGAIQGYFELLGISYVGADVTASALAMDKEFTKIILADAGIPVLPHLVINKRDNEYPSFSDACKELSRDILFVKPARAGSSVGISKVQDQMQWEEALTLALLHDDKILIEPALAVREVEIGILDDGEQVHASIAGEIAYEKGFYDYEQKYSAESQVQLHIPALIHETILAEFQQLAIKAHQKLGIKGLSRVDFFLTKDSNEIFLNEINTLPGFTDKSMYPLLWQSMGLSQSHLLKKLIESSLKS
ncbi:D-alanine--D-alanine ligase family protein [Entomospira culicis]|uniref:D-alanine--D-alanine ligase n=1 Tax=Entomospira culicis TaxID=2719989 RepID=A0A968KWI4_9SPIO|nr:D-alanine--D-alanine ligase family protein [Entomospira culicis]NIZ19047.1 D-alanine--D-alanine ligase [Entomospira culicis]NIZ69262.1 D-alanine--D-alanine ligase [Entomospira culicis]WDI37845.1 D-alanine--D-alanine ligase [Entomospira culicis]WDI39473.1 D-alanine--D-alanine ligase [Entomospira culicis]